jgi:hypothetical protein
MQEDYYRLSVTTVENSCGFKADYSMSYINQLGSEREVPNPGWFSEDNVYDVPVSDYASVTHDSITSSNPA